MRDRAELLVGRRVRAMWVMTFHSACARMLRAHADRLGYTRQFTIYDQADSRRLVKRCLDELGIDPKRFTPGSIQSQISDAKNKLRDADAYGQMVGSFFEQTVADVYRVLRARAAPHERDGLRRPAVPRGQRARAVPGGPRALRDDVPPRARRRVPGHQPRPVPLAAAARRRAPEPDGGRRRRAVPRRGDAGDDGRWKLERPIEEVRVGERVRSGHGYGAFAPARVLSTHRSERADGIRITTASGRTMVSTPEHTHFAGLVEAPCDRNSTYVASYVARSTMSLCGGGSGGAPAHRITLLGADGMRDDIATTDMRAIDRIGRGAPGRGDQATRTLGPHGALPFIAAVDVEPGMAMFDSDRRLRRRRIGRAGPARTPRLRPRHRAHAQLHRQRDRHPQLDLRLPRRRHHEHPRVRGHVPRRPRGQARAELPLDADDPRRRQRGDLATTAGRSRSRCGPRSARATRSRSASSTTSTPRRGSSPGRSSGWSTRASRARRSRSSTGRTRSRACSRTRWCEPRSPTR